MENDSKYLIGAYQKKSFDLFNQSIAAEAKAQSLSDLVDAYKTKIEEVVNINKQLSGEIENLRTHVREREEQLKNISEKKEIQVPKRTRKKIEEPKTNGEVRDGGSF